MSTKGQGHYLTIDPRLSKYDNFKHIDPRKPLSPGTEVTNICSNSRDHMTSTSFMPKYSQILSKSSPQPISRWIDNWYVASGTPEIPGVGRKTLRNQPNQVQDPFQDQDCSDNDLGLTLTFLYGVKHREMLIHMISWTVLKTFAQEFLMMT